MDIECTPGYFGRDCQERCSGHCKNNESCDHVIGVCPGGCQDGYMDEYCNSCKKPTTIFKNIICALNVYSYVIIKLRIFTQCIFLLIIACKAEHYGINCTFHCSSKCNGTCNHLNGSCEDCEEGWIRHCYKGNNK